jgi:hypothetical protein
VPNELFQPTVAAVTACRVFFRFQAHRYLVIVIFTASNPDVE